MDVKTGIKLYIMIMLNKNGFFFGSILQQKSTRKRSTKYFFLMNTALIAIYKFQYNIFYIIMTLSLK